VQIPTECRTALAHVQARAYKLSEDGKKVMVFVGAGREVSAGLRSAARALQTYSPPRGGSTNFLPPSAYTPGQLGLTADSEATIKFVNLDELEGIPDAKLAEDIMPVRMAIVVASFPWKQQLEEYRKALQLESIENLVAANAKPQFLGFEVERAEVWPGQLKPQWVPIDLLRYYTPLALLTGKRWQEDNPKLDPVIIDHHAAWYRLREFRGDQYPEIELQLKLINETLAALKAQRGQTTEQKDRKEVDKEGRDIFSDDRRSAGGTGPTARPGKPAVPPKDAPPKPADDGATSLSGQRFVIPEYVLLRFLDVTIEPGKTYKYRFRVRMANPNYKKEKEVAWTSLAKDPELKSDWAYVPDKVRVPVDLHYYAVDLKTQGDRDEKRQLWNAPTGANQVPVQVHGWMEAYVPPDTGRKKALTNYVTVGDWVIAPRALLTRGAYMGVEAHVDVPVWNVTGGHFALAQSSDRRTKKVPVFFGVGLENGPYEPLLVDFSGGPVKYDKYAGMDEDKNQPKYTAVRDTLPTEMLIMSADGKLLLRNSETDWADPDRTKRFGAWRNWIDNVKQMDNSTNTNPQPPGGKPNSSGK
jgi:hypothetical protein